MLWPRPPRFLVVVAGIVLAVTGVLAVLGALSTGVTTDEPIHVMRLDNFFDTGWYALDWDYRGAGPAGENTNTFVYGPVGTLVLHGWSVLWGADSWGHVSETPYAYDVRHLGVVLIAAVGLLAVAGIGRVLLRSWGWGLVAAAALAAIPTWTGNAMMNVKDVPVATGHTLVTLGLLLHLRRDPPTLLVQLGRAVLLVAGLVLTLGTRPGMVPGIAAVVVVAVVGIVIAGTHRLRTLVDLAASGTIAACGLVLVYPNVFASPVRMIRRSTAGSSDFYDAAAPDRWYLPRHLAEEVPTLLLVFAAAGAVVAAVTLVRGARQDPVRAFRLAVLGAQASTLPVLAIVVGSDLYHGLRQILFALPAMAVLATCGIAWTRRWRPQGWRRPVLAVTTAAALVLPVIDQVSLQPYQTSYVNLATDLVHTPAEGTADRRGNDYWRTSIPELVDRNDLPRPLLCKTAVRIRDDLSLSFYPYRTIGPEFSPRRDLDCREERTGPLWPERLPVPRDPEPLRFDAVFIEPVPGNCVGYDRVTRRRHGFGVVVSTLARCRITPPLLPRAAVRGTGDGFATGRPRDLWRFAVLGWLQQPGDRFLTAPDPRARITFVPNEDCRPYGCTVLLIGDAPADLVVTDADGRTVPSRVGPDGVRVDLGPDEVAAADGVWLTVSRAGGGPLGMRLTGIRPER